MNKKMLKIVCILMYIAVLFLFAIGENISSAGDSTGISLTKSLVGYFVSYYNGKEDKGTLKSKINQIIDVPYLTTRVLDKNYGKFTAAQKKTFITTFDKLIEQMAYESAGRYFANNKYIYESEKSKKIGDKHDLLQVTLKVDYKTKKGTIEKETIVFYYIKINKEGKESWVLYDVDINGESLVIEYKTQMDRIIKSKKAEGLLSVMKSKLK